MKPIQALLDVIPKQTAKVKTALAAIAFNRENPRSLNLTIAQVNNQFEDAKSAIAILLNTEHRLALERATNKQNNTMYQKYLPFLTMVLTNEPEFSHQLIAFAYEQESLSILTNLGYLITVTGPDFKPTECEATIMAHIAGTLQGYCEDNRGEKSLPLKRARLTLTRNGQKKDYNYTFDVTQFLQACHKKFLPALEQKYTILKKMLAEPIPPPGASA